MNPPNIFVIIPAYNEENSIQKVLADIPKDWVKQVIVVNNNSNDNTAINAKEAGATVIDQPLQGYGNACLKGIEFLSTVKTAIDYVVFLDADYSDHPNELPLLMKPLLEGEADLVIGSRALGQREKGSMTPQQVFGNALATFLIKFLYKVKFTDLGPFRALSYQKLLDLGMEDKTYGWTVEMQVKAAKKGWICVEVPVSYRKRIGHSKISGTIKGTILAGYKIITTIFKYK